jgi:hypothetical protein
MDTPRPGYLKFVVNIRVQTVISLCHQRLFNSGGSHMFGAHLISRIVTRRPAASTGVYGRIAFSVRTVRVYAARWPSA